MASLTRQLASLRLSQSSKAPQLLQCHSFSTASTLQAKDAPKPYQPKYKRVAQRKRDAVGPGNIPPYPYGDAQWFKQSDKGLYAGRKIRFGNMVSEKNEIKNRRKWHPNVRHKALYSEALGKKLKLKLVTRVLRTIDKAGGLDRYVTGEKPARVKSLGKEGWRLRAKVMKTEFWRRKMAAERARRGLHGPAPWEITSVAEALELGYHPESMGLTWEEARQLASSSLDAAVVEEVEDFEEEFEEEPIADEDLVEQEQRQTFMSEEGPKR